MRPAPLGVKDNSLATPLDMAVTSDGQTLYVAAFGSSKIGVFDTAQLEADTFIAEQRQSHRRSAAAARAASCSTRRAAASTSLTRFDNGVSVIDTDDHSTEIAHLPLYNPEPASVVDGRPFLYDAVLHLEQRRGVVLELPHLRRLRQPGLGSRQSRRREDPQPAAR